MKFWNSYCFYHSAVSLNMDARRSNQKNTRISYPSSEVHLWYLLAGIHSGLSLNNVDLVKFIHLHPRTYVSTCCAPLCQSEHENKSPLRWLVALSGDHWLQRFGCQPHCGSFNYYHVCMVDVLVCWFSTTHFTLSHNQGYTHVYM